MAQELLRLEKLSKYYTGDQNVVMGLNAVSLRFCAGEFVAVTGRSGSGKSTLGHILGGLLGYESGELYVAGRPTSHFDAADYERYRRDEVSFISQSYGILPGLSVEENVMSALRLSGMEKAEAKAVAKQILTEVELWSLKSRRAAKLSSGQKQRLSIARALAKPGRVLIADEPTGNLDPENSKKVIDLLRRAAKTRLVILITHEFSEAGDAATRRIELSDGQVVLDTPLRAAFEVQTEDAAPRKQQRLSAHVAALQLKSRPVWSVLCLAFFALTAFAVFAFFGTFLVNLDDTYTKKYDNSAFLNGSDTRVVILAADGSALTEEDAQKLLTAEHTVSCEPYGYVTDVSYAWREGTDYTYQYSVQTGGDMHNYFTELNESVSISASAPFLQTIPIVGEGETFLTAGREPENIYEVVLSGDESRIGETFPVFIRDEKNWNISAKLTLQVTVVGVTELGEGLYFHRDLGRAFNDYFTVMEREALFLYAGDLPDDLLRPSERTLARWLQHGVFSMQLADVTAEGERLELQLICRQNENEAEGLAPTHTSYYNSYYEVSRATFDRLVTDNPCDQMSLTIEDYAYLDRVLEEVRAMGYIALSPYREGATKVDPTLAKERTQTLTVCALALAVVALLQILVLRALFTVQNLSYGLLRDLGLTGSTAKRSVYLQLLMLTVPGQILGAAALPIANRLGVERIAYLLRHLPPGDLPLLSLLHLLSALAAAAWISAALAKQLFPVSLRQDDLDFGEAEV